ncbi:F-box protein At4g35930-like isoform X2 [Alnus glutinosa]|uniref:F-box protein At4g35930-like isoform X2 n=1 Tax=Alnus glutinosa TaxID=3517 RepID=UPI002D775296|nr:F-box protein At4g35930-like isoform X2 [Alnus glutinosa]
MSGTQSESQLESLPKELLVKIICHLHHDQLRAVFHVSNKRIRKAVLCARRTHFNYTTPRRPDRVSTPPAEHLSLQSMGDGTPPAPRRRRPRSRLNFSEDELSQAVARIELNS